MSLVFNTEARHIAPHASDLCVVSHLASAALLCIDQAPSAATASAAILATSPLMSPPERSPIRSVAPAQIMMPPPTLPRKPIQAASSPLIIQEAFCLHSTSPDKPKHGAGDPHAAGVDRLSAGIDRLSAVDGSGTATVPRDASAGAPSDAVSAFALSANDAAPETIDPAVNPAAVVPSDPVANPSTTGQNDPAALLDIVAEETAQAAGRTSAPNSLLRPPTPLDRLITLMIDAALSDDQKALIDDSKQAVLMIVAAPSVGWVEPISVALKRRLRSAGRVSVVRSTIGERGRTSANHGQRAITDLVAAATEGSTAVVVHADPMAVPATVQAGVDLVIAIPAPTPTIILAAIAEATGEILDAAHPPTLGAGLDATALTLCLRSGLSAGQMIDRLMAASASIATPAGADDAPSLESLAGFGEARSWGLELAAMIKDIRAGTKTFADIPRPGAILAGPPGVGKTFFARALAKSCGLPLIATSCGAWLTRDNGHLGAVVSAMTEVFQQARAIAPSILFIDELDAIPDRATLEARGRDWWNPVITQLLALTDGVAAGNRRGVILLGATNHPKHLDAALLRPGRFEQTFHIGLPDDDEIAGILAIHAPGLNAEACSSIAPLLAGRSAAAIASIAREARFRAEREGRQMQPSDIAALVGGDVTPTTLRKVAIHEAGHAIVALALGQSVETVTTIAVDRAAGATIIAPTGGTTRADYEDRITIALAGRAADVMHDAADAGASADLRRATDLLLEMHMRVGLGERLASFADDIMRSTASDTMLRERIDADLHRLHARARRILVANAEAHRRLVDALIEHRVIKADRISAIVGSIEGPEEGEALYLGI